MATVTPSAPADPQPYVPREWSISVPESFDTGVYLLPAGTVIGGTIITVGVGSASAAVFVTKLDASGWPNLGVVDVRSDPLDVDRINELGELRSNVLERLRELASLPEGWFDGDSGTTPTTAAIAAAREVIPALLTLDVPRPRIAPTEEGGVEAEWSLGDREVSVTFEPDGQLFGQAVDFGTDETTEPTLNPADKSSIAEFVLGHAGA